MRGGEVSIDGLTFGSCFSVCCRGLIGVLVWTGWVWDGWMDGVLGD